VASLADDDVVAVLRWSELANADQYPLDFPWAELGTATVVDVGGGVGTYFF